MKILIVTTGGTIAKSYQETTGNLVNQEVVIDQMLDQLVHSHQISWLRLFDIDSADMQQEHRQQIKQVVLQQQANYDGILITHGTDTMVQSARFLQTEALTIPVIFTGSMRPFLVAHSDALQNVSEALFAFHFLPKGSHIVFHSQAFDPKKTRKNFKTMRFEALS